MHEIKDLKDLLTNLPKLLQLFLVTGAIGLVITLGHQQWTVWQFADEIESLGQVIKTGNIRRRDEYRLTLQKEFFALKKDQMNAQNSISGTLVQGLGGIFFIITAYFTWENLKVAKETAKVAKDTAEAGEESRC
jgi:hypothetical protein